MIIFGVSLNVKGADFESIVNAANPTINRLQSPSVWPEPSPRATGFSCQLMKTRTGPISVNNNPVFQGYFKQ